MSIWDYLKLGLTGVKAHKKGVFLVVVISGVLYSIMIAATLLLQGLDNAVMGQMLEPTGGKVLLVSEINQEYCEKCRFKGENEKMKANVQKYGGRALEIGVSNTTDGKFYQIPASDELFSHEQSSTELPEDVVPVVVPFSKAAELSNYEFNPRNSETEYRLNAIKEVNARALHHIVQGQSGQRYYIAQILPDAAFAQDLSFLNIGQKKNPLDIILQGFRTGASQNFQVVQSENAKNSNNDSQNVSVNASSNQAILAIFDNIDDAYRYYKDKANYCASGDQAFGACNKEYKYQTTTAIGEMMENYEKFQRIWSNYRILVVILLIIAISVMVTTYVRLIAKDEKIINLYKIMGAQRHQLVAVFSIYLFMVSSLVAIFSLVIGVGMVAILNALINTSLSQVFSLAFGQTVNNVVILGWNNAVWCALISIIFATVLTLIIEQGQFSKNATVNKM